MSRQDELNKQLWKAAKKGQVEQVRLSLDQGAEINACMGLAERSSLQEAALHGHFNCVRLLLERGAQWKELGREEYIVLQIRRLIGIGAAADLLSSFVPIDQQKRLNKALLRAVRKGKAEEVSGLLDRGADITALFWHGWDQCHYDVLGVAITRGHGQVVGILLSRTDDLPYLQSKTLLVAAKHGCVEAVQALLTAGIRSADAAAAARNKGHSEIAKMIREWDQKPPVVSKPAEPKAVVQPPETPSEKPPEKPLQSPNEIIFEFPVADRVMQEVFNFTVMERITMVRNGSNGPVETVSRSRFAEIQEVPELRKAFEEHVSRGGTVDEAAVFPSRIVKSRPPGRR